MSRDRKLHSKPSSTIASVSTSLRRSPVAEATFQPKTELGRELWDLRQKIRASGEPLLDAEEIDREVSRRRGGIEPSA